MKTTFVLLLAISALALVQGFAKVPRAPSIAFVEDLKSRQGSRIISGYPAVNGQFPYQAFLLIHEYLLGSVVACGGTLIAKNWVLTAAHCLELAEKIEVHLGDVNFQNSPVVISSEEFIIHEGYDVLTLHHDVALIKLSDDVTETQHIKVIPYNKDPTVTYVSAQGTVSGFGAIDDDVGAVQLRLNYVGVRIISNADCDEVYSNGVVIDSTLCAVGAERPEQGTCVGDSGGPLTAKLNGADILIGVVSFGHRDGCATAFPNGFMRLSHYDDWLTENME